MKTAVFLIYEAYNVAHLLDLANQLMASGRFRVVFYSPYHLPKTTEYINQCKALGISYLHEVNENGGPTGVLERIDAINGLNGIPECEMPTATASPLCDAISDPHQLQFHRILSRQFRIENGIYSRVLDWVLQLQDQDHDAQISFLEEFGGWTMHYFERTDFVRSVLRALDASILVFPEANVERDSYIWVKAGHESGAPSLVVTCSPPTPREAAQVYFDSPGHQTSSLPERMFAGAFPHWRYEHAERGLLRLPAPQALAQEWCGIAPRLPWILNSGNVDALAMESEFLAEYCCKQGLKPDNITVTGSCWFDTMAKLGKTAALGRQELYQAHGIPHDRPMLLCAMPPDQYPTRQGPEFASYHELVSFWIKTLLNLDEFHLVVSPHPSIIPQQLAYMESLGATVVRQGVGHLIPLSDGYVASVSSTIKWALACGKPVINYDVYRYDYDEYEQSGNVATVFTSEGFLAETRRLKGLGRHLASAAEETSPDVKPLHKPTKSAYWGPLDGQSKERIANLMDCLLERRGQAPAVLDFESTERASLQRLNALISNLTVSLKRSA